jgi:hypothetical protein
MLIIFFIVPCQKAANASNSGVVNHYLFLCLLTPFGQRQSLRQLCGFADLVLKKRLDKFYYFCKE